MKLLVTMYITEIQPHSHSTTSLVLCHVTHTHTPYRGLQHTQYVHTSQFASTVYFPGVFSNGASISLTHALKRVVSLP